MLPLHIQLPSLLHGSSALYYGKHILIKFLKYTCSLGLHECGVSSIQSVLIIGNTQKEAAVKISNLRYIVEVGEWTFIVQGDVWGPIDRETNLNHNLKTQPVKGQYFCQKLRPKLISINVNACLEMRENSLNILIPFSMKLY